MVYVSGLPLKLGFQSTQNVSRAAQMFNHPRYSFVIHHYKSMLRTRGKVNCLPAATFPPVGTAVKINNDLVLTTKGAHILPPRSLRTNLLE